MYGSLTSIFLLLLFIPYQTPRDSIRQHYEKAEAERRAGKLDAAQAEYEAILAEAYHQLGRVYFAQGKHQEAVLVLEATAAYGTESEANSVELAIAYFHTAQFQKAVEPLNRVLAKDPGSAAAHQMLGKTYFMMGQFEKSVAELKTALALAPNNYDVTYTLGLAYLKQRQLAPAKQVFDQMIARLGNRPQLRVLLGRAYRETGFLPEAIDEFKKGIALDPQFPRVHYYLGLTYLLKDGVGRIADAAAEFRIELAAHPDEFFANYYLGIASTFERKWDVAIGHLQKAVQIQPDNPDPYFFLGQAYQGTAQYDQAVEVLKKSIALTPNLKHNDYQVTNAHFRLGQSLVKAGRVAEGEKELQMAAELKSKAFKRDEAKVEAFTNAVQTKNDFPELISAEAIIAETNAPDAKTREALKADATYYVKVIASAHNNIGLLSAERQNFRAAAEQFRVAAKWDPDSKDLTLTWDWLPISQNNTKRPCRRSKGN